MPRSYEIDWERLVLDMVPAVLRRPRTLAYLAALLSPLVALHSAFLAFRRGIAEELPLGPEVRVMEYYLNSRYDPAVTRIKIYDGQDDEPLRIFTRGEDQPIYLPVFLADQSIDFTVELPDGLQGFEPEIRRFLDRYKLLTKSYRIIYRIVNP